MNELLRKHTLKVQVGTVIIVIGFLVYWTFTFTTTFNQLEAGYDRVINVAEVNASEIMKLKDNIHEKDIILTKIEVKLAHIEALLVELKNELK